MKRHLLPILFTFFALFVAMGSAEAQNYSVTYNTPSFNNNSSTTFEGLFYTLVTSTGNRYDISSGGNTRGMTVTGRPMQVEIFYTLTDVENQGDYVEECDGDGIFTFNTGNTDCGSITNQRYTIRVFCEDSDGRTSSSNQQERVNRIDWTPLPDQPTGSTTSGSSSRCASESIQLNAPAYRGVTWQVSTSSTSGFGTFTPSVGGTSATIRITDIPAPLYNTNLYFRYSVNGCNRTSPARGPYRWSPERPRPTAGTGNAPSYCGNRNGSVTLTGISRSLLSGERLTVSLYKSTVITNPSNLVTQRSNISTLPVTLSSPGDIPAGTYYILVESNQSFCGGASLLGRTVPAGSLTRYTVTGGGTYCTGSSGVSVGLSDSRSGVTYRLLRGGSNTGITRSGTGNAISFGTQTTAGTYTVRAERSGCSNRTMSGSATVSVNTTPSTPSTTNATRCGSGSVTLRASGAPSGGVYRWYTAASGGSHFRTGSSYTVSLSSTTTYYVSVRNNGCESGRRSVRGTINSIPATPTASDVSRCGGGTVNLTASAAPSGHSHRWYASSTSTTVLSTSRTYSPNISSTQDYYVLIRNYGQKKQDMYAVGGGEP